MPEAPPSDLDQAEFAIGSLPRNQRLVDITKHGSVKLPRVFQILNAFAQVRKFRGKLSNGRGKVLLLRWALK